MRFHPLFICIFAAIAVSLVLPPETNGDGLILSHSANVLVADGALCNKNQDCATGWCYKNACANPKCSGNQDCPSGAYCYRGNCRPIPPSTNIHTRDEDTVKCKGNRDCPFPAICEHGSCRGEIPPIDVWARDDHGVESTSLDATPVSEGDPICIVDKDCPPKYVCYHNKCEAWIETAEDISLDDAPISEITKKCKSNKDCPFSAYCENGTCRGGTPVNVEARDDHNAASTSLDATPVSEKTKKCKTTKDCPFPALCEDGTCKAAILAKVEARDDDAENTSLDSTALSEADPQKCKNDQDCPPRYFCYRKKCQAWREDAEKRGITSLEADGPLAWDRLPGGRSLAWEYPRCRTDYDCHKGEICVWNWCRKP